MEKHLSAPNKKDQDKIWVEPTSKDETLRQEMRGCLL